jgi:hypothetical protein
MVMICRFPPAHGPSQIPDRSTFIAQSPPPSKIAIARDGPAPDRRRVVSLTGPGNRTEPAHPAMSDRSHFLGVEQEFSHLTLSRETKPNGYRDTTEKSA